MADFLSTLFGGGAEADAANANRAALGQFQTGANANLAQGYGTSTGYLNQQVGAYTPLQQLGGQYNQAGNLYLGALGAGGPQGTAAAQAAFQNAPGYQGAVTAGLDAINRRRGTSGMYNSGNADQDAQTFGQNLQNQQYNTWLQALGQAGQTGVGATTNAATGQATGYGNLAGLATNYSTNLNNVLSNVTSGNIAANNQQFAGQAQGAQNILGAGLSLASLAL
jgi:hypothetical protein